MIIDHTHQKPIPDYALLALVNILMNYEIFLSRATIARWEEIVHIGRGLSRWHKITLDAKTTVQDQSPESSRSTKEPTS